MSALNVRLLAAIADAAVSLMECLREKAGTERPLEECAECLETLDLLTLHCSTLSPADALAVRRIEQNLRRLKPKIPQSSLPEPPSPPLAGVRELDLLE